MIDPDDDLPIDDEEAEYREGLLPAEPRQGTAPDPYEDDPEGRLRALAPLLDPERPGGLVSGSLRFLRGSGEEKLDLLLSLPDPEAVVQALSPEEFVLLVQDVGLSDAPELLMLASPRQLQVAADLDGWQGAELDQLALGEWLMTAAEGGDDVLDRFVAAQEDSVWTLFLGKSVEVVMVERDDETLLPPDVEVIESPDGTMQLVIQPEDPALPAIRMLVDALFRDSVERGRTVLLGLRWELPSQLEEDQYELRSHRVEDYGFLSRDEALEMYAYRDPFAWRDELHDVYRGKAAADLDQVRPYLPDDEPVRTGLVLRGELDEGFLGRAIARLPQAELQRVRVALTRLAYRSQTARAAKSSAWDELPRWSRHAARTAGMGLEFASAGDEAYAALLLTIVPLVELFRAGHSLVVIEHMRARRLLTALGGKPGLALLEPSDAWLVAGLSRGLPMWIVPARDERDDGSGQEGPDDREDDDHEQDLDDDGEPAVSEPQGRPVETLSELAGLRDRLQGLGALARLAAGLVGGDLPGWLRQQRQGPRLTTLLNTLIASQILTGRAQLAPLSIDDLRRFLRMAFEGDLPRRKLRADLRQGLMTELLVQPQFDDREVETLGRYLQAALDRLGEELGGLDPAGPLDAHFVGEALLLS